MIRFVRRRTSGSTDSVNLSAQGGRNRLEKLFGFCRRNRRGAATVEFAVVAPIFILFVFGMIEFGRAVMVQQILTNAAREGCRLAVLDNSTTAAVTTAVTTYLTNASINGATVSVSPSPPSSATYGQSVTISVTIPFSSASWLPTPMFLNGKTFSAKAVMRREATQ